MRKEYEIQYTETLIYGFIVVGKILLRRLASRPGDGLQAEAVKPNVTGVALRTPTASVCGVLDLAQN